MNSHKYNPMDDAIDSYIRQSIRNWAAQRQPRANGRARLLLVAASPASPQARPVNGIHKLLQHSFGHGKQPADPVTDSFNLNWQWAMHISYAQLRHVA